MTARKTAGGPLVAAATALEEELHELEALAAEARRLPLTSRKNVEKTAAKLQELGGADERIGARLRAVIEAITALGEHQRATLEALAARAEELQRRRAALVALVESYQALGTRAQELTAVAKQATAGDFARAALGDVRQRVEELAAAAEQVARDAGAQQFDDVSRDADALRQSLLAIRNRLGLLAQA